MYRILGTKFSEPNVYYRLSHNSVWLFESSVFVEWENHTTKIIYEYFDSK